MARFIRPPSSYLRKAARHRCTDQLDLIKGDAIAIDEVMLVGLSAYVVANLPYNVGTALLLR